MASVMSSMISHPLSTTVVSTATSAATTTAVALPLSEVALAFGKAPTAPVCALLDALYAAFAPFAQLSADDTAVPPADLGALPPRPAEYTIDASTHVLHGGGRLATADLDLVLSAVGHAYLTPERTAMLLMALRRYATIPFTSFVALWLHHSAAPYVSSMQDVTVMSGGGGESTAASDAASALIAPNPFDDDAEGEARASMAASIAAGVLARTDGAAAASIGAAAIDLEAMTAPLGVTALGAIHQAFALFDTANNGAIPLDHTDLVLAALERHVTSPAEGCSFVDRAHAAAGRTTVDERRNALLSFHDLLGLLASPPPRARPQPRDAAAASAAASAAVDAATALETAPPLDPDANADAHAVFASFAAPLADDPNLLAAFATTGQCDPLYSTAGAHMAARDVPAALEVLAVEYPPPMLPWLLRAAVPAYATVGDMAALPAPTFARIVAALIAVRERSRPAAAASGSTPMPFIAPDPMATTIGGIARLMPSQADTRAAFDLWADPTTECLDANDLELVLKPLGYHRTLPEIGRVVEAAGLAEATTLEFEDLHTVLVVLCAEGVSAAAGSGGWIHSVAGAGRVPAVGHMEEPLAQPWAALSYY